MHVTHSLRFKWALLPKSIESFTLLPHFNNNSGSIHFAAMCDDGRPKISLEDRLSAIAGTFAQAYFGHAPTSAAIWSELERYCDALLAATDEAAPRSELLQGRFCGVLDDHPLNAFPVSRRQRRAAVEWMTRLLECHGLEIGARVCFAYESLRFMTAAVQIWADGLNQQGRVGEYLR